MRPLTPKQEKFAQLYVELGNASEAYRKAYRAKKMKPASVHRMAKALLDHLKVASRIAELRSDLQERHEITVDGQCAKLEKVFKIHHDNSFSASAAVSAVMGQSKLAGLIVDKQKLDANVTVQSLPPLSPDAAAALKQRIEAERF